MDGIFAWNYRVFSATVSSFDKYFEKNAPNGKKILFILWKMG